MIIDDMVVSYKFGPKYDMDIRFSSAFQMQAGLRYDQCRDYAKLIFQLLCHAVQQIQYVETKKWRIDKIEECESWEYPTPKQGETLKYVIEHREPILVNHPMTYAKYQIIVEGRLVLTLSEDTDCDFLIDYYDPTNDEWLDWIFDYAEKHCERFGRME